MLDIPPPEATAAEPSPIELSPIETTLLRLVEACEPGKSIDPIAVARAFIAETAPSDTDPEAWRRHLSAVRRAAMRLAADGRLEVLRKGKPVPPEEVRGVIRLRRRSEPAA